MKNFKRTLSIFIPLLLCNTLMNAEAVKIPPIVIKQENSLDNHTNILSNLKKAIVKNRKSNQPSKEEEAKAILEILKKSIPTKTNISSEQTKKVTIPKRVVKKHLYKKVKKKIKKKIVKIIKKDCSKIEKSKVKQNKKIKKELNNNEVDDFKDLPFVKPIEIIKVSKPFEASSITSIY